MQVEMRAEPGTLGAAGGRADDPQALAKVYSLYALRLRRYVGRMVANEHDAEDVVQSVFVKLMPALARYEDRGHGFDAWIYRIACNAALDHLRVRARCDAVAEIGEQPSTHVATDWDASMDLQAALSEMSATDRQLLLMRHVIGMSSEEIASALGSTVSGVDSRHYRARRRLRSRLTPSGDELLSDQRAA